MKVKVAYTVDFPNGIPYKKALREYGYSTDGDVTTEDVRRFLIENGRDALEALPPDS
jgi:hypothetical protein